MINQNPCPVELVFLGGCWTRHNIWLCPQPRFPRRPSRSAAGHRFPLWPGPLPSIQQVGSWPVEAEGTRSEASVHSSCQESWPQVEPLPEGLFVSSGSELNPCTDAVRAALLEELSGQARARCHIPPTALRSQQIGEESERAQKVSEGEDVDNLVGISAAVRAVGFSGNFVFHR